ncbi:hypothetical protein PR202_ga22750 [Eleusine coracana subsp. coracana]|uniref:Secreted protein n=1 Tax=Eleusine coracana subsp. coracana TaxID=191504 RepID=A0AAV5D2I3_ELECO|nr:hypothetical protein PR202_ga22750 [Eleusine coracana subsp. coracana]
MCELLFLVVLSAVRTARENSSPRVLEEDGLTPKPSTSTYCRRAQKFSCTLCNSDVSNRNAIACFVQVQVSGSGT